ncbi:MAG: hypothetical protein KDA63_13280, partial [Planctomycetales bacterium]|nr:hypothetical protein [Planctomycetales bacterium]
KRRNRSWQRQLVGYAGRAVQLSLAAALLAWVYLAVRYFGVHPRITHNYLAEMDADYVGLSEDQRAWPLYREALMDLHLQRETWPMWSTDGAFNHEYRTWAAENQRAVALCRKAAARPQMGFFYQDRGNVDWLTQMSFDQDLATRFLSPEGPTVAALLPHIQEMRTLGHLLLADAWTAAERSDAAAVVADIDAMLAMSDHVRDTHSFLVTQLVSLALFNLAAEHTERLLEAYPALLDDEQLATLDDRFRAALDDGQIAPDFLGERAVIADTLQRVYSDDGKGGGHVTRQGWKTLEIWMPRGQRDLWKQSSLPAATLAWLAEPLDASRYADRREMTEAVAKLFDEAAELSKLSRWQRGESLNDATLLAETVDCNPSDPRWRLLWLIAPPFESMLNAVDQAKQQREAVLTVIALQRYRLEHGEWPAALADLVPDLLPAEPVDQATGEPLQYGLVDGLPLLYSVGGNGTDDGGIGAEANRSGLTDPDGDWVLWPPPPPPAE